MLYHFLYPLREYFFGFNVVRYITFRALAASITAFLICVVFGPRLIAWLRSLDIKHTIERAGFSALYEAHAAKEKVPTMGGLLILSALMGSTLLWADLHNRYIWITVFVVAALGAVGFADDYLKLTKKNAKGLPGRWKLMGQLGASLAVGAYLCYESPTWLSVSVPFLKTALPMLGALYILFVALVIVGASNAVNLTDGLDGLAIGCTVMIALTYALFAYVTGNYKISNYLQVPYVAGVGELAVFCAALFGAGMGFLWFNSHPASVFMGDTGSLSLGGALGVVAVLTKKELLLVLVGGVFVIEAVSVILQVGSYKFRKKRIFRMAPIHHHFQLSGLTESKVVIRFWIVSIILALWGLATLKLQ